ncbi:MULTISPECIES: hypothetical protein [Paenibacillus]|nr:hypothetical protein [Paenibacillus odorifer]MEC0133298.1 hypothetical protein [Paenibacillus odorifer]
MEKQDSEIQKSEIARNYTLFSEYALPLSTVQGAAAGQRILLIT